MTLFFNGADGLRLAYEAHGEVGHPEVLFLHGAGQTRRSWTKTAMRCAASGYRALTVDARGHGESDWHPDGDYLQESLADDVAALLTQLPSAPVIVGASMSGMSAMIAAGRTPELPVRGLVLVDIAPTFDPRGASRITAFMQAAPGGFEDVEEAAEAVATYNPARPRPASLEGLRRNLREIDGRYFWHWDPRLFGDAGIQVPLRGTSVEALARRIVAPTLLIRGEDSDLIRDEDVEALRAMVPHSRFVDIAGAGHMIVGDRNDAFSAAVLQFLETILPV